MDAKRQSTGRVFALKAWTVKSDGGKFFISPTAWFDEKQKWHGPYKTLQNATAAIARKLAEEFLERAKRLEDVR
jgi:hypothetical protein